MNTQDTNLSPLVGVIMGSRSDWPIMQQACNVLEDLDIAHQAKVVSAHRTPARLYAYARDAEENGLKVIIAGAGGAAHLPGMIAAITPLPVLGVPISTKDMGGLDSLYSIVQMPFGVPVGCMKIGEAGAKNAALMAASILGLQHPKTAENLKTFRAAQTAAVGETPWREPS